MIDLEATRAAWKPEDAVAVAESDPHNMTMRGFEDVPALLALIDEAMRSLLRISPIHTHNMAVCPGCEASAVLVKMGVATDVERDAERARLKL